MNKELVIDILQEKKGLEEALSNFLVDIRENQDKRKYYHFLVDEEKIYYYSDYNKKINNIYSRTASKYYTSITFYKYR